MRRRWGTTRAFLWLGIATVDFIFLFRFLFSLLVDVQKRRYPLPCDNAILYTSLPPYLFPLS